MSKFTESLIVHAGRQALTKLTVQTARACLVSVLKPMCNSDFSRIDK